MGMFLESPDLLKDTIAFIPVIFGFILKVIPVFVEPFELILNFFEHVSHLLLQIMYVIFGLDRLVGGKLIFFDLNLVFLLVLNVTDRFEIVGIAVVWGEKL